MFHTTSLGTATHPHTPGSETSAVNTEHFIMIVILILYTLSLSHHVGVPCIQPLAVDASCGFLFDTARTGG